jgi:hypothetical protein
VQQRRPLIAPCDPWRFPDRAEGRPPAMPGRGPRQKGQFAEGALPAGDALVRNCRKACQMAFMIAKTLFLA